ncbi:MAG: BREX system Lon protease-like protein BrxL [Verrucomicrobiota bacterium]
MTPLDKKINLHFAGLVVRKDLTKTVKGNAIVPSYVLEYLLGQHCATDDEASIQSGIETVKNILAKHFVHRNESELIKSTIKEKGRHKIIDKITVELNDKAGVYEAQFTNLGLKRVQVDSDYIKKHPKLLVGGVWSIAELTYHPVEDPKQEPWHLESLKPIQVAHVDVENFLAARKEFTTDEWMDVLLQSMGFNPEMFSRRGKLVLLVRLVPYCERNYNMIELGPKGTGKSHIYSEFSPHGILISGGEITVAKLFVNNASGKIGLVGYWDCVCFDEFAGKDKKVDKNLVDIMKNYMANKSFSRGIEMLGAEASMVFMGNTRKSVPYMMKHSHFFEELPDKYIDSAFLDRLHCYNAGWESSPVRSELFTSGFGFIVDYLAEILRHLRSQDFSQLYSPHFELNSEITTRDRDGVQKTFSGLMKVLFPHGESTKAEIQEILAFAMEGRRRVKEQILKIDETFVPVAFTYTDRAESKEQAVVTLEETQYPTLARRDGQVAETKADQTSLDFADASKDANPVVVREPQPGHLVVPENGKGYSYRRLFADHLRGARQITLQDSYIRAFWQIRNFMEFVQLVHELTPVGEETKVNLITKSDPDRCVEQDENLRKVQESCVGTRVSVEYEFDKSDALHARSITTDHGWKISLDRGLDIFQRYEISPFSLVASVQEERLTKAFEVTYIRVDKVANK